MVAVTRTRARPRRALVAAALAAVAAAALVAGLAGGGREPIAPPPPARPPGLGDLWAGRASLVLERIWTTRGLRIPAGAGAYSGAHVEVVGGTWYLFDRRVDAAPCPGAPAGTPHFGTQVRASRDRGATWGPPVTILAPGAASAWACAAGDGDAAYDAATRTWRYLFQCMGAGGGWHGCYAERRDADPLGPFTAPRPDPNPVIDSGGLWGRICAAPAAQCRRAPGERAVGDEGTFDLFPAAGGGWWVGFHGYDGVHGYRGLARTTTFRRGGFAVAGADGTPRDAVIDAQDAAGWRETWAAGGPVGPGAARVLAEDGWYYQLAEVPDTNLACTPGQRWDLGLFRSADPAATTWAQYPAGNPIVYSSLAPAAGGVPQACNVEYPGLFRDPATGRSYVMYGRPSTDPARDGIYVYGLEWNRNLLANGDFARADASGWQGPAGAPAPRAERAPDGSPDGTPDLVLDAAVAQQVPARGSGTVAFGAELRTGGGAGAARVLLEQLDGAGAVIARTALSAPAGPAWAKARGRARLDGRTRALRYRLTPEAGAGLRADNLYAIPQAGCSRPRYPVC
jgi:hypothetical protein